MKPIPLIDLHEDLMMHISCLPSEVWFPKGKQTDFDMLRANQVKIVVATAFPMPPREEYFDPITNQLIEDDFLKYIQQTKKDLRWRIIDSSAMFKEVMKSDSLHGIILHVEGLNVVDDTSWERLERWYQLGWRSLGPVWNLTNPLGGGTKDSTSRLTPLGRKVISWLQSKRMIVDFAHMNRPTFWDALEITKGPIIISHGGACTCHESPRNYTDDQLRAVAATGGIMGAFFANTFIVGKGNHGKVAHVADHIDHLVAVMGIDHVALGTDFGGIITGLIDGLTTIDDVPNLWVELQSRGYTASDLEKISYKNAERVLSTIL
jgi:membrane dipeptidase